jgi:hypothetical protein
MCLVILSAAKNPRICLLDPRNTFGKPALRLQSLQRLVRRFRLFVRRIEL